MCVCVFWDPPFSRLRPVSVSLSSVCVFPRSPLPSLWHFMTLSFFQRDLCLPGEASLICTWLLHSGMSRVLSLVASLGCVSLAAPDISLPFPGRPHHHHDKPECHREGGGSPGTQLRPGVPWRVPPSGAQDVQRQEEGGDPLPACPLDSNFLLADCV